MVRAGKGHLTAHQASRAVGSAPWLTVQHADVLTLSNLAVALRRFGDNGRADALTERIGGLLDNPRLHTPGYYDSDASRRAKLAENLFYLNHPRAAESWTAAVAEVASYRYWWWSSVHEQGALLRAKVAQSTNSPLALEVKGKRFESRLGSLSDAVGR